MKYLLLAPLLALAACGHSQHGLRIYTPTTGTDAKGNTRGGTALLVSANADMPGVKRISTPEVNIEFEPNVSTSASKYNAKGQLIATSTMPGGLYTSEVTRAQGEADKSRGDSVGNGAAKAAFFFGLPGMVDNAINSIWGWLNP